MNWEVLALGAFEANCTVLTDPGGDAVFVDPGAEAEALLVLLKDRGLTLRKILLTHGHIDHISALDGLLSACPVPVILGNEDIRWAFTAVNSFPPYVKVPSIPSGLEPVSDGTRIRFGAVDFSVIATPGHTPGGICFYSESEKLVISGDTLFAGSVGRTDLPGGDWEALQVSLAKLMKLPADTVVVPGHGGLTDIGTELKTNPYLRKGANYGN